jgi:hypothetical protein
MHKWWRRIVEYAAPADSLRHLPLSRDLTESSRFLANLICDSVAAKCFAGGICMRPREHRETVATVIPEMEAIVGNTLKRLFADKGYRGHNAPPDYKFRVFISG